MERRMGVGEKGGYRGRREKGESEDEGKGRIGR